MLLPLDSAQTDKRHSAAGFFFLSFFLSFPLVPGQIYGYTQSLHNNKCVVSFHYTGLLITACDALVVPMT